MGQSVGRAVRFVLAPMAAASIALGSAAAAPTTQYSYDALGRLVSAIGEDGKKVVYTYDAVGNRTRLSNGAEFAEILPTAWSASSNAGTTGLTATNGMRDGAYGPLASIHVTQTEAGAWVKADLGSLKAVNHIEVAPALAPLLGAGVEDLNDSRVEYSTDGTNWKYVATISGATLGATRSISLGGVNLRYLRLYRSTSGQIAIGDLKLFSAAVANSSLIAQPDSITSTGSAVTFDPRANDQDLDGYSFTISSVDVPIHGTAIVNSGASITYTPTAGYFGADSFTYGVADGHNGVASARVSVMVRSSANLAPVAVPDSFSIPSRVSSSVDGTVALRVLANDFDSDGDVLSVTSVTTPSHGAAAVQAPGAATYQPAVGYVGSDSFSYTISDGASHTATATITLTVGNSAPLATADNVSTAINTAVTLDVKANDSDSNGDTLTVQSVSTPAHGTATLNGNQSVTYAPSTAFVGSDAFTYVLSDGNGKTAIGSVGVSVADPNPSKILSVMQASIYASAVTISGSTFTVPSNTAVNVFLDAPMTTGKFYWEVKFLCGVIAAGVTNDPLTALTYGGRGSNNAGVYSWTNSSWRTTTYPSSTFTPGVPNDVYGFALDADTKALKIYQNNTLGVTMTLPFAGPYYAHSGVQPGYAVTGQACGDTSASARFQTSETGLSFSPPSGYSALHGRPDNRAPSAVSDSIFAQPATAKTFDPRLNDTDPEGDTLTITAVSVPNYGTATVNSGTSVTYTAPSGFSGIDAFSYTISDPAGHPSSGTVMVMVQPNGPIFSISPAVSGKTSWNLDVDGPLNLSTSGTWTLTPQYTFTTPAKAWGAGGGAGNVAGGAGGYASGYIQFTQGVSYNLYVGGGGAYAPDGANGGANGGGSAATSSAYYYHGAGGGGYSGVRLTSGPAVLIAGGGGGSGWGYTPTGGGGGGSTAEAGAGLGYTSALVPSGGAGGGGSSFTGATGGVSSNGATGGGGGGGYLGGGGGPASTVSGWSMGGGGGGGTGYADTLTVSAPVLTAAQGTTPAASGDSDRGTAGSPAVTVQSAAGPGRLILGRPLP